MFLGNGEIKVRLGAENLLVFGPSHEDIARHRHYLEGDDQSLPIGPRGRQRSQGIERTGPGKRVSILRNHRDREDKSACRSGREVDGDFPGKAGSNGACPASIETGRVVDACHGERRIPRVGDFESAA